MVAPYSLAMVVCDAIHRDPGTGKSFILGTFSAIGARAFPTVHHLMGVYIALTDGHGKIPIKLILVDADEEQEPLFQAEAEIEFTDPRAIIECVMHFANTRFPQPGEYRLQLHAAGEFLIERRIIAHQLPEVSDEPE